MKKLNVKIVNSKNLSKQQIQDMFVLMCRYYDNVNFDLFEKDLQAKDVSFLLCDNQGKIQGFTSLVIYKKEIEQKKIAVVFSGDTIVDKNSRGSFDLPFAWLRYVYKQQNEYDQMFWLMLSKGYRTYRLLPRFFRKHYPNYKQATPAYIKLIMDSFAQDLFGSAYNPQTNIFIPATNYFVKLGKSEISPKLLKNSHIKFFQTRNPGFWQGHELVNLAVLSKSNLTVYGLFFIYFGDSWCLRSLVLIYQKISKFFS